MNRPFRIKRGYRNLAIASILFWIVIGSGILIASLVENPAGRIRPGDLAFAVMPLFFAGLSLLLLAAYYRERLVIKNGTLKLQGVGRRRELSLNVVHKARWRLAPLGGSVVLKSVSAKMTVHFGNYERSEVWELVRFLHAAFPDSIQEGWPLFRYKHRTYEPGVKEEAKMDAVHLTRRRWDWIFGPTLGGFTILGIVLAWITGQWHFMIQAPLGVVLIWVMVRFLTPREGIYDHSLSSHPNKHFFKWLLGCSVIGLVSIWMLADVAPPWGMLFAYIVFFAVILWRAGVEDRTRREADLNAARRWVVEHPET